MKKKINLNKKKRKKVKFRGIEKKHKYLLNRYTHLT